MPVRFSKALSTLGLTLSETPDFDDARNAMDDFLTPISTIKVKPIQKPEPLLQEIGDIVKDGNSNRSITTVDSPSKALELLKDKPSFETVESVLRFLVSEIERKDGFHPMLLDPIAANIVHQLIHTTIPDYWQILKERGTQLKQLVRCFRNPSGIGNIITRLRSLIADRQQKKPVGNERDSASQITDLVYLLERMLHGDQVFSQVWKDVAAHGQNVTKRRMMWKEFVVQTASGRILSVIAEAGDALKDKKTFQSPSWLADGGEYASWLGRNIANLMSGAVNDEETMVSVKDMFSKSLYLGYVDQFVRSMLSSTIEHGSVNVFSSTFGKMKAFEQQKYLNAIIISLSKQHLNVGVETREASLAANSSPVAAVAYFINELVEHNESMKDYLVTALVRSVLPSLEDPIAIRRSVIAVLAKDEDRLHNLLENGLKMFGDSIYIKHTPILQQEVLAQTLAITCGYVQRSQPMFLTMMARSSYHTSGMSNRIGSSSPRARFLGIAVGMTISEMVDKPESQLKFELDGSEATEAQWYRSLTKVHDLIGKIDDLKIKETKQPARDAQKSLPRSTPRKISKPAITEIKGPRVIEVLSDDEEDEDDDLVPYSKPDSDPEDETDDPTEINRNKPIAPVYVRDLVAGLRDTENYDRHALALSTAAPLIRRKANFGSEVLDHIDELATVLLGLNDSFELEKFAEQRQEALIAVLLAKPAAMAQWFARNFFAGDYSLTQRTAVLTTLGLGARELAGLKNTSDDNLSPPAASFPSKQLPPHLHALYASQSSSSTHLARITSSMTKQLLSPLAAQAADTLTGPSILKVGQSRTFSSRMEVEARRSKPIPNALSQLVAENFFFPLTGRWWLATRSSTSPSSLYTSTHLLPTFLHTLALLMNASGPNTVALPQMTRELWELLLSCRAYALEDKKILSALLFAFLMLLETNADKERLATEQGKELMETQEWVRMVFEGLPAGREGEEDDKVRVLAAGVVVRCQEVVEKYQRRLAGSLMNY